MKFTYVTGMLVVGKSPVVLPRAGMHVLPRSLIMGVPIDDLRIDTS